MTLRQAIQLDRMCVNYSHPDCKLHIPPIGPFPWDKERTWMDIKSKRKPVHVRPHHGDKEAS